MPPGLEHTSNRKLDDICIIAVSAALDHLINKTVCKLQWAADGQATKHSVLASVRAKTSRRPLRCRVRDKKGSQPKSVVYALAGAEELLRMFAVVHFAWQGRCVCSCVRVL
jgi:hypothetical protein